jgi:hypothetical protein
VKPNRFLLALVFSSVLLFPSAAQQPPIAVPSAQRDAHGLTILTQCLLAMGPLYSPTRTTLARGIITYPDGTTKTVSIETIGNDSLRHDIGTNDFAFVSSAGDGFLILGGKKTKLPSWITAYKRAEHLPGLSLMSDYQNPNLQVQYVALESVNGNPAHHLRLSMLASDNTPPEIQDMMSEFQVWIDQASLLVVKTRHFDFSPQAIQNRTPVDIFYSDYRVQDGATVPFHLTRFVANQKQCEIVFSTISLTAAVSVSDFQ